MLFSLSRISYDHDVECKSCGQKFEVVWDTEYRDPLLGIHSCECPECKSNIRFEVYTKYTQ